MHPLQSVLADSSLLQASPGQLGSLPGHLVWPTGLGSGLLSRLDCPPPWPQRSTGSLPLECQSLKYRVEGSGIQKVKGSFLSGSPIQRPLFMPIRFWSNNLKFHRYKSSDSASRLEKRKRRGSSGFQNQTPIHIFSSLSLSLSLPDVGPGQTLFGLFGLASVPDSHRKWSQVLDLV